MTGNAVLIFTFSNSLVFISTSYVGYSPAFDRTLNTYISYRIVKLKLAGVSLGTLTTTQQNEIFTET